MLSSVDTAPVPFVVNDETVQDVVNAITRAIEKILPISFSIEIDGRNER
jgi:hypothetical protein